MVVEKLKEREDKRDEERDKVHNPDLEQRVKSSDKLVKTIRMTKERSWFHIYKVWEKYEIYVFNLAWEYELNRRFDSIKWAEEYCELIKPKH